jgi:hypothetical protein
MSKESIEDSAAAEGLEQKTAKVEGNSVGMRNRLRMLVVGCGCGRSHAHSLLAQPDRFELAWITCIRPESQSQAQPAYLLAFSVPTSFY